MINEYTYCLYSSEGFAIFLRAMCGTVSILLLVIGIMMLKARRSILQ